MRFIWQKGSKFKQPDRKSRFGFQFASSLSRHTDMPHASSVQIPRGEKIATMRKSFGDQASSGYSFSKQSRVVHFRESAQTPARSRIDLSTFSASKNSRASS